jgi:predicted secreted protein
MDAQSIADRLRDDRGRRVAFVSHCLLNENARYLGGAFRPAGVVELINELIEHDIGICQMPCPEQHAWGGVLKRRMLRAYSTRETALYRFRGLLLRLFILYTRLIYRRLAREIATQISDYHRSGFTVVGIIGVGASPSCGVHTTLDIRRSFEAMASMPAGGFDRSRVNREVVLACRKAGAGMFIQSLQRQLRRRGLAAPLLEHDLAIEMRGERQRLLGDPGARLTRQHADGPEWRREDPPAPGLMN